MQKDRIQLEDISSVTAGQTALINCPSGPRYHDITLVLGDSAATTGAAPDVDDIVDTIIARYNGEDIWNLTGADLDVINTAKFAGLTAQKYPSGTAGAGRTHLRLCFADPSQEVGVDRELLALPTDWLSSDKKLQLKVKLVSGVTSVLTAWATIDDYRMGKPLPILKMDTHDFNVSSASIQLTNQLPRTGLISQFSFFDTTDGKTVEAVEIKVGRITRWKLSKHENWTDMKSNKMNPAAGCYHANFDLNNGIADMWNIAGNGDMVCDVDFSAAASGGFRIVSARYEMPKLV